MNNYPLIITATTSDTDIRLEYIDNRLVSAYEDNQPMPIDIFTLRYSLNKPQRNGGLSGGSGTPLNAVLALRNEYGDRITIKCSEDISEPENEITDVVY